MKRDAIHKRAVRTLILLCMAGVTACAPAPLREAGMSENNPLLQNPRPWCIGRMVIDRPAGGKLAAERYAFWGDKVEIMENVTEGTFQHKVKTREQILRTKKRTKQVPLTPEMLRNGERAFQETTIPWLEQAVSPTPSSRIMIFRPNSYIDGPFEQEGYMLAGTTMLVMKSSLRPEDIEKSIRLTSEQYQHMSPRDDWAIPTERGFCIKGALIGGSSRNSEEVLQTLLLMPEHPATFVVHMREAVDVDLNASLRKTLPELRRQLGSRGLDGYVRVLREGKRKLAGMNAEEVLLATRDGNVEAFSFYLLAPGTPGNTGQPHTSIELRLGAKPRDNFPPERATSPVDEAGAIQAWDTLLDSMRLRSGAL